MGLIDDLDRRRERANQTSENSARLAQAYATFTTDGQGTIQYEHEVEFGLTFIEEPVVSYGAFCDVDDLAELQGVEDTDDVRLPLLSGYVVNWNVDDRGFYVGCWVGVRVYFPPGEADPGLKPQIDHHFTISGMAMKDIPFDATDATN